MRIVMFTAVKGGVGVSTLALALAKALARRGIKVTLVDMDTTGYISHIAGIYANGLLAQIVDHGDFRDAYIGNIDGIRVLKFLGDGTRFFDDIQKLERNPDLLERLVAAYSTAVSEDNDYVIIDVTPCFLELALRNPFISYWLIPPASFRIYVTDNKKQSIHTTINFINKVEKIYDNHPFAVIINKAHFLQKSNFEELREALKNALVLTIPFMPQLQNFSERLDDLSVPDQIEILGDLLVSPVVAELEHYFTVEIAQVKSEYPIDQYIDRRSILLLTPPGNTDSLDSLLTRLSYAGDLVVIRSPFIERRFHFNEYIVSPLYKFMKFEAKNINDIYKLAKRLGEEVLRTLANRRRPVVVLVNEAELGPESPCCDVATQKREFWRTFLRHLLENSPELRVVLVCEDTVERRKSLANIFEVVVEPLP